MYGYMKKALRIITAVVVTGGVLHLADLATRDCRIAPYTYDDCLWMRLRSYLGLPPNRFLRMAALEFVGLVLILVLWLTFRYLFPLRRAAPFATDAKPQLGSKPPTKSELC
jgi:hypothetical protein